MIWEHTLRGSQMRVRAGGLRNEKVQYQREETRQKSTFLKTQNSKAQLEQSDITQASEFRNRAGIVC